MKNISVVGTDAQKALVLQALGRVTLDIDSKLLRPYRIEFHTSEEFRAAGFVFADGSVNWGRVAKPRVLWVNSSIAARKPYRGQYVVIHELGHAIDADWNDGAKRRELVALMASVNPGTGWAKGAYLNKPQEIYADAFVEALGMTSPLDADYGDIADADLPKLLAITFRVAPPTPAPAPEPDPVPEPLPGPSVGDLQAQIETLTEQLAAANGAQSSAATRASIVSSAAGYLMGDVEAAVAKFKERVG